MCDRYRKCAKCGITAVQDPTLTFHRFPKYCTEDPETFLRSRIWAEFCYPKKNCADTDFLKYLHSSRKMICSKHFAIQGKSKTPLNKCAIPIGTEHILQKLKGEIAHLGKVTLEPKAGTSSSLLLNDHFEDTIFDPNFLKSPASTKVCRICLTVDAKLYNMTDHWLNQMYEDVTGIFLEADEQLPKVLCWECAARLKSAQKFKVKATNTYTQLMNLVNEHRHLTVETTQQINNYKSPLIKKYYIDHYDLILNNDDKSKNIKEEKVDLEKQNENGSNDRLRSFNNGERNLRKRKISANDNVNSDIKSDLDSDDNLKEDLEDDMFCDVGFDNESEINPLFDVEDDKTKKDVFEIEIVKVKEESPIKEDVIALEKKVGIGTKKAGVKRKNVKKKSNEAKKKVKRTPRAEKDKIQPNDTLNQFIIKYLNYEQQIADMQKRSESPAYLNAKFKCNVCYTVFRSKPPLDKHSLRHSESLGKIECAICKFRLPTQSHLRHHIKTRHTEQFTCQKCDYVTTFRVRARKHLKTHSGQTFACPHCNDVFKHHTTYFSHLRLKHPSRHVCELCGHTFLSSHGVFVHKNRSHPNVDDEMELEGPFCETCDVKFLNEDAYQRHLLLSSVHSTERKFSQLRNDPYYLSKSGPLEFNSWLDVFGRKGRGRKKITKAEEEMGIACEVCEERIFGVKNYCKHVKTEHPGHAQTRFLPPTHMCEVCGKIVPTTAMTTHLLTHSQEKLRCPHCHKAYTVPFNLKRHIITAHKGLRYPCEICGKELTTAASRREHITHVHHGQPRPKRVRVRLPEDKAMLEESAERIKYFGK